ncbi:MAG: aminotransferase class I/II-fold pyridoxal phosphate-dependent enzyme [Acidobacteriota bacterium]
MNPIRTSSHVANVTYAVRDVVVWAQQAAAAGRTLIPLNIGDPCLFDFKTPEHVIEAIVRALRENKTSYTASEGTPQALAAIRHDAEQRKGIRDIRYMLIGHGASEPIEILLTALLDAGESVLVPQPGYPLYQAVLAKLGVEAIPYDLDESNGWQPNPAELASKIKPGTRALVLINPNNPTGSISPAHVLEELLEVAARHQLVVLSDEIYDRMVLDDDVKHVATASLRRDIPIATFAGLSKVWLGPGLRLGWCILSGPDAVTAPLAGAMAQLARARLCASHPVQCAVAAALEGPQDHIREVQQKLRRRRDITVEQLERIPGFSLVPPQGAFYAFPRVDFPIPDTELVRGLIENTGVVLVHGTGFGQRVGTKHVRIVFLPQEPLLTEAYEKIRAYCRSL